MIETKYNILGDNVSTFAENDLFFGTEDVFVLGASGSTSGSTSGSSSGSSAGSPCNMEVCMSYTVSACTSDCVSDGICSNNIISCTALLNPPLNCPSVFNTYEIATEGKLYKNFGVGTNSSSLCTTKTRVTSLGLAVNGSYSDNQLVLGSNISIPSASSVSVSLDIILDYTSVKINGSTYNITSQGGWLVPSSYSTSVNTASRYLTNVGNSNVFGVQCLGSSYIHVVTGGTGGWGTFSSGHNLTNSTKTMGSLTGTKTYGTYSRTVNAGNALDITFNLRLKISSSSMESAYYVKSLDGSVGSIRATGFNINVTPYGVELASSQQTNSVGYIEKTSWSISNGVGSFKGILHITVLEF